MRGVAQSDLEQILAATAPLWEEMRGQRLFLTGGTGFFGTWLMESFVYANRVLGLEAEATVLTRHPDAFRDKVPHLAGEQAVTLLAGDVRDFAPPSGEYRFVVHAATAASASLLADRPAEMLSTIVDGTEKVLRFAAEAGTRKLLFTSSGAVYGKQPSALGHVSEDFYGAPDPLSSASAYGEGKRFAELLCAMSANPSLEIKIARCFAFVGPHLPLDTHFAAGNFIADALFGRTIAVGGDGTSVRSYLYASDLVVWLWTMLFRAASMRAYNVGSEDGVSISELAEAAARVAVPRLNVSVARQPTPGTLPARYVPSTRRAREELGLGQTVSLDEALRRTLAWHRLES